MLIAYIRVSSKDQNTDRQIDSLHRHVKDIDKIFEEHTSGKDLNNREIFKTCMDFCREGDHLVMTSIDRCARSLVDLMQIVNTLKSKGVTVEFLKERLLFNPSADADAMSTLMLQLLGSFAEFERTLIRERQAAGIKAALARGVNFGRKHKFTLEECQAIWERSTIEMESKASIAKDLGVTRQTIYSAVRRGKACQ